MNFFEKKLEKVWRYQKNIYLCSPVRKTDINKFIEKTDLLYKKQVPRKNNLSRSVNSFERNYEVSESNWKYRKLYNEEFDPGSG